MNVLKKIKENMSSSFEVITDLINKEHTRHNNEIEILKEQRNNVIIKFMKTKTFKDLMMKDYVEDIDLLYVQLYFLNMYRNGKAKNDNEYASADDTGTEYYHTTNDTFFSEEIWSIIDEKFDDIEGNIGIYELDEYFYFKINKEGERIFPIDTDTRYLDNYYYAETFIFNYDYKSALDAFYEFFERNQDEFIKIILNDYQDLY